MQQALNLDGGWHAGPLFVPRKRRAPKPRMQSTFRDRVVAARIPGWADRSELRAIRMWSKAMTRMTGVQHSQDHIVPLNHPIVCGLHCPDNIRIVPLADNLKKSNIWWPDMPGEQIELCDSKSLVNAPTATVQYAGTQTPLRTSIADAQTAASL